MQEFGLSPSNIIIGSQLHTTKFSAHAELPGGGDIVKMIYVLKKPTPRQEIVDTINSMHKLHLHLMQQYDLTGDFSNVIEANDLFNNIIRLRELVNYWPTTDDK